MEFTGERVIPKKMNPKNGLLIEHIARYKFASMYTKGRVLDLACGVGYGAEILMAMGEGIEEIIGIDVDEESVSYAKKHYKYLWNDFFIGEGTDINLVNVHGKFDTIVSMETVEHIEDDYGFIQNLNNLLRSNGTLIVSTPFGKGRNEECSNPYHYRQYREEEFRDLLSVFENVEMFYQRDKRVESKREDEKYYLMVAVCNKKS
ncbi:class I SAM-dependent methyltransferase [Halonatronum saccharophilum]|uniref:class I SAM-dependent methyltransferase n=1 Tax=Halonatronum saccharophilum TaxID=150060 RepID=UPI000485E700|nr:methyltransferase domain-containing protein [Halonatronum saccharophilum]